MEQGLGKASSVLVTLYIFKVWVVDTWGVFNMSTCTLVFVQDSVCVSYFSRKISLKKNGGLTNY